MRSKHYQILNLMKIIGMVMTYIILRGVMQQNVCDRCNDNP